MARSWPTAAVPVDSPDCSCKLTKRARRRRFVIDFVSCVPINYAELLVTGDTQEVSAYSCSRDSQ